MTEHQAWQCVVGWIWEKYCSDLNASAEPGLVPASVPADVRAALSPCEECAGAECEAFKQLATAVSGCCDGDDIGASSTTVQASGSTALVSRAGSVEDVPVAAHPAGSASPRSDSSKSHTADAGSSFSDSSDSDSSSSSDS